MIVNVYTDGSCHNDSLNSMRCNVPGAWAYVVLHPVLDGKLLFFDTGFVIPATSQTMEIAAVYNILKELKEAFDIDEIRIHSDSAYVVECFHKKWYEKWELLDYVAIKNEAVWRPLIELVKTIRINTKVTFIKVKGHSGDEWNELVDKLAGEERYNGIHGAKREVYKQKAIELLDNQRQGVVRY